MLPQPSDLLSVAAVATAGAVAAVIDLRTRRIPNALSGAVAATGLTLAAIHAGPINVSPAIEGMLVGFLLMMPGYLFGGMGGGDVKLFAALGTLLGPGMIALAFLYTAVAGGVLALSIAMMRRTLTRTLAQAATFVSTGGANVVDIARPTNNNRFAYAPAIAIGAIVAALNVR
ncbi:MAG TPA: A24 family peptidase [Vicinamibacterales bacterium]|jgi:prepilin peptidase CpaA|nr:A24 family peptidase [Vicinamibacterales bacterium]